IVPKALYDVVGRVVIGGTIDAGASAARSMKEERVTSSTRGVVDDVIPNNRPLLLAQDTGCIGTIQVMAQILLKERAGRRRQGSLVLVLEPDNRVIGEIIMHPDR